jgi:uncharacterized OB-fold protein
MTPTEMSGKGSLYSFATVDRLFHAGFAADLPYVVGLVELDEQAGVRMLTNIVEAASADLRVGMAVEVTFEDRDAVTLPQFRPRGGAL